VPTKEKQPENLVVSPETASIRTKTPMILGKYLPSIWMKMVIGGC
jgi:hypothetical protein